jgi:large subunit ribosomal protein L19
MRLAGSAGEIIRTVEGRHLKAKVTVFTPGDTVRVTLRVPESGKERLQVFEGVVTARRGHSASESFTVRKISFGIGVERTFPVHSPFVTAIEVVKTGRVRRSKLYFLRDKSGKAARLKQGFVEAAAAPEDGAVPEAALPGAEAPAEAKPSVEAKAEKKAEAKPAKKEKKAEPKK